MSLVDRVKKLEEMIEELGNFVGIGWSKPDGDWDEGCPPKNRGKEIQDEEDDATYVISSRGKGNRNDLYYCDDEISDEDEWTSKIDLARKFFLLKEAENNCKLLKAPDKFHSKPIVVEFENE